MLVTIGLLLTLGGVFLAGFSEAVGVAVPLVVVFLALNLVVVVVGAVHAVGQPVDVARWIDALLAVGGPEQIALAAVLAFPLLVLGLSGFETGVSMMPLIRAHGDDDESYLRNRIANTRTLLTTAALIMSGYLVATSLVTADLRRRPRRWQPGGPANGRALAYLAHMFLGDAFGTAYDISSILILWFAGASAMAGLINIVPRYLPGYGMAPEWSRAVRPVVLVYTGVAVLITWLFEANVDAQAGAYATGILAMMMSAAVAVTVSAAPAGQPGGRVGFGFVTLIFVYAFVDNVIEKPDGIVISLAFIAGIVRHLAGLPAGPGDGAAGRRHRLRRGGAPDDRRGRPLGAPAPHREQDPGRRRRRVPREGGRAAGAEPDPRERPDPVPGDRGQRPVGVLQGPAGARREGRRLLHPAGGEHGRAQRAGRDPCCACATTPACAPTCTSSGRRATRSRTSRATSCSARARPRR